MFGPGFITGKQFEEQQRLQNSPAAKRARDSSCWSWVHQRPPFFAHQCGRSRVARCSRCKLRVCGRHLTAHFDATGARCSHKPARQRKGTRT